MDTFLNIAGLFFMLSGFAAWAVGLFFNVVLLAVSANKGEVNV